MQLLSLSIRNFRNLKNLTLECAIPVTAFVGENAQGKTNLLEAIHVLSLGKSLRADEEKNLINYDADFFRLEGKIQNDAPRRRGSGTAPSDGRGETRAEIFEVAATLTPRFTKQLKINGQKLLASEYLGHFPTVLFVPEDLNLLLLAPASRRRYLDVLLSTLDRAYLHTLTRYTKALKNRNALLLRIADGGARADELEFWDSELATHGTLIGRMRAEWLAATEDLIANFFQKISGTPKKLRLALTNFSGAELTPKKYLENLTKLREKDLRYGTTNYGPHRADLSFTLDGVDVAISGSRGEVRSVVLALKFAELQFLEARLNKKPVLLLDDVFSELDRGRQEHLLELIGNYQTFITTTKVEHLASISNSQKIWHVRDGTLSA